MPANRNRDTTHAGAVLRSAAAGGTFWLGGLLLAFHPTVLTGFARMQGAPVDTRFNNYLLEHTYRWLLSAGHHDLWNPNFFFPVSGAGAFGDVELAVMPGYALWRFAGMPYDRAFQLWTMTMLSLNFAAFWLFLRRAIRVGSLAAGAGAFLSAFGAPRVNQVGHEQLFAQFYAIAALYALYRLFPADDSTASRPSPWLALFFASLVAQLYSGFYFGWFVLFAMLLTALWAAALPSYRRRALSFARAHWRGLAIGLILSVVATAPLWAHYIAAAQVVGFRDWARVEPKLPRPQSWVYLGPFSRLYRWQYGIELFRSLSSDQEHRLGVGVATTLIAGLGLYWRRRDHGVRLLLLVAATIVLCVTAFPVGTWVWRVVFEVVPGANAIRAVARIGMLMLIPAGLGVAYFVESMRARPALLGLALAAVVAEQAQTTPAYDARTVHADVASLAGQISAECPAFLFTPLGQPNTAPSSFVDDKHQLDAMWAALLTGVPTLNGFSGNFPPDWPFHRVTIHDASDEARLAAALDDWSRRRNLDAQRLCWIRGPVDWSWTRPRDPLWRTVLDMWE